jgi:hypothetical protein
MTFHCLILLKKFVFWMIGDAGRSLIILLILIFSSIKSLVEQAECNGIYIRLAFSLIKCICFEWASDSSIDSLVLVQNSLFISALFV